MLEHKGLLYKMSTQLLSPVAYQLTLGGDTFTLNDYLGKKIKLSFTGNIVCQHCQRKIKKSYSQGYCFPCFKKLAQCDMCIMKPETCHYDRGTCREPEWADKHCMQNHTIYLANSSGLKVGITRNTQIPTRWMDQGAIQALPLFEVKNRLHSGLVEVLIAEYVADKTNWRAMLKGEVSELDMIAQRDNIIGQCEEQLEQLYEEVEDFHLEPLTDEAVVNISYPVLEYPKKIISHNVEKNPHVEGILLGIKGQYLIFDSGVINIRKHSSYEVSISLQS